MALRFLVVEGNTRDARQQHAATYGMAPSESYAVVVGGLASDAICDIAFPADEGANLPDPAGLEGYDGVFLTGSALHAYRAEPRDHAADRACAGCIQMPDADVRIVLGTADGRRPPAAKWGRTRRDREVGFARSSSHGSGRGHPLLAGRPAAWDAPAIHLDLVTGLPDDVTVLAQNSLTPVQAAEIRHDGGVMWGVQYHPEYSLAEISAILGRRAGLLMGKDSSRARRTTPPMSATSPHFTESPPGWISRGGLAWTSRCSTKR